MKIRASDTSDEAKKKLIDHIKKTNREIEDEVRNDGYLTKKENPDGDSSKSFRGDCSSGYRKANP